MTNGMNGAQASGTITSLEGWHLVRAGGQYVGNATEFECEDGSLILDPCFELMVDVDSLENGHYTRAFRAVPVAMLPSLGGFKVRPTGKSEKDLSHLSAFDQKQILEAINSAAKLEFAEAPRIVAPSSLALG